MGLYRSLGGMLWVQVLSADVAGCLQSLERAEITAYFVHVTDSVTVEFLVAGADLKALQQLCLRKGYTLTILKRKGLFWPIRRLLGRPVLVFGIGLLVFLSLLLPSRILVLSVEGNQTVPSRYILSQAEEAGLKFWTERRSVRSEQIKNELLEAIPQLQWVGVNTYGCRGVITVRERPQQPEEQNGGAVSHIAASRDGVIYSCTATQGSKNCTVGQAVKTGDILISGYTDCGLTLRADRAEGVVQALTRHEVRVISPSNCRFQSRSGRLKTRYALLLGKKRINFYKGSGISGATCDKMYSKYVLTLPGGFTLPVALLQEPAVACYMTVTSAEVCERFLEEFAEHYLLEQMSEGAILQRRENLTEADGVMLLEGTYDCIENIGIVQDEKIGELNG